MKSRVERINAINKAIQNPEGQKKISWRGQDRFFEVITLHSDMLMFRIENSRTSRQQQAYIKQHSLTDDFFNDQESQKVQEAQESILLKMAKSQSGFIDDLKERKQKDELIITRDGYIVNGNRRTSALKDIGVTYYKCAVLPEEATAKDIYTLEQELQISTDFRMDYDWVNELNNIRDGLQKPAYAFTERELAQNLRISQQALRSKLMMIDLIDQYLSWSGQTGNYSNEKLDKAQQAFEELEKGLKKINEDTVSQETFKNEVFALINIPPKEGRLYDHIRYLVRYFDSVQAKITSINPDTNVGHISNSNNDNDPLSDIIGTSNTNDQSIPFKSPPDRTDTERLVEAINDAYAEHRDTKDAEALFTSAKKALRSISGYLIDSTTTRREETIATLNEIISVSNELIYQLKENEENKN